MGKVLILACLLLAACGPSERVEPASEPDQRASDQPGCNRGNPNAPIRLEVFSDDECPSCRAFYLQTMKQIFTDYADTGKVCVVYREYPTYPRSREAARFARAALRLKGTPTSFITACGQTEKVDGALTYAGMQRRLDGLP